MPEGPECYKTAQRLKKLIGGRTLVGVDIIGGRYENHGPPLGYELLTDGRASPTAADLGIVITDIWTKGKLIVFEVTNNLYFFSTLGLSGKWTTSKMKHAALSITVSPKKEGGRTKTVYFVDQLHYGTFSIVSGRAAVDAKLKTLGIDVLDHATFTWDSFQKLCRKHNKKALPEFLMNQKWIAGIGNYLKAEIMYHSRSSVSSPIVDYSDEQLRRVYDECLRIPFEATFGKYRLAVYNRRRDPLGHKVFKVKTPDKRTTHWVPAVMPIDIKNVKQDSDEEAEIVELEAEEMMRDEVNEAPVEAEALYDVNAALVDSGDSCDE
jgi:formamidopyrimidine-DNA glycosylase